MRRQFASENAGVNVGAIAAQATQGVGGRRADRAR
jgi:hypothetical protein